MQDPEFEKQVRQKMDELKFSPSASVWTSVEKEINKDKKRRRPIVLFFLLGALLLSGTGYLFFTKTTGKSNVARAEDVNSKTKEEKPNALSNDSNATGSEQQRNKKITSTNFSSSQESNDKNQKHTSNKSFTQKINNKEGQSVNGSMNKNDVANNIVHGNAVSSQKSGSNKNAIEEKTNVPEKKDMIAALSSPVINKSDSLNKKIEKKDTTSAKNNIAKQQNTKKSKPWTIGFSANAGISNIYEGFFGTSKVGNSASPSYYGSSGAPGTYHTASPISNGFSFSAGVVFRKPLGNRFSFTAGLNYHYYSTQIQTGSKIDSPGVFLSNPAYSLSASTYNVYYFSGSTNTYTNQYHFIELPVNIQWQLNQGKKVPLFWEAGLILSGMVASDELHFDDASGIYYKDKSSFNKVQLSASTAILIGWHLKKGLAFQAGPQLQYGITGLLPNPSGSQQHLFFGGIKIDVLLLKKN